VGQRRCLANDAEHDGFWEDWRRVQGFDPEIDMINTSRLHPLATLAQYKSIVWDVYRMWPGRNKCLLLYSYISHRPRIPTTRMAARQRQVLPNVLALAMAAGGHIS